MTALGVLHPDWTLKLEPVQEWESFDVGTGQSVNLLQCFYDRQDEHSFRTLQVDDAKNIIVFFPSFLKTLF